MGFAQFENKKLVQWIVISFQLLTVDPTQKPSEFARVATKTYATMTAICHLQPCIDRHDRFHWFLCGLQFLSRPLPLNFLAANDRRDKQTLSLLNYFFALALVWLVTIFLIRPHVIWDIRKTFKLSSWHSRFLHVNQIILTSFEIF